MAHLKFIFVHGLSGWGEYDAAYCKMPYWGMRGGDLMTFLRGRGYDCRAASVSPAGSAWDRACELYAQLAGARVDYGKAHSDLNRHARYGRDYTGQPLIEKWDRDTRLVLLGHSFGGPTVRLFSLLLARGDEAERQSTSRRNLSPLFAGSLDKRLAAVVTLASPMNGTTAYDLFEDPSFHPARVRAPLWSRALGRILSLGTAPKKDGRDERDYAAFDMRLDSARAMNERIPTLEHVYYFSVHCSFTLCQPDGTHRPERGMEALFVRRSYQIGAYTGRTAGGLKVDERWRENDGLVNTLSASAPDGAPAKKLDWGDIRPGVWNIFPTIRGDHMWPQGGLTHRHDIVPFYQALLSLITRLEASTTQKT